MPSPLSEDCHGTRRDNINWYLHVTALQPQEHYSLEEFYNLESGLQNFGLSEDERGDGERKCAGCRPRLGCLALAKGVPPLYFYLPCFHHCPYPESDYQDPVSKEGKRCSHLK